MYLRNGLYLLLLELGDLIADYDSVMTAHTVKICISLSALLHEHDNALFTSWPPSWPLPYQSLLLVAALVTDTWLPTGTLRINFRVSF